MNLPKYKYFLAINDFFSLITSFYLAGYFSSLVVNVAIDYPFQDFHSPLIVFAVASSVFILIFQSNNLYKINLFLTRAKQLVALIKSLLYGIAILLILSFFIKFPVLTDSRVFILVFTLNALVLLIITRILIFRRVYGMLAKNKILNRNILIVGAGKAGKLIATKIFFENPYGIHILGFVDDNIPKGTIIAGKIKVLGAVSDLNSIAIETKINEVIIAIDNIDYHRILEIVDICNNLEVPIKIASELFGIVPQKVFTESYNGIPIIEAMSQKIPVVVSDIAVHREIAGDAALFFNSASVDDFSEKLYNSIVNQNLRDNITNLGFQRAGLFSWEKSAKKMIEIYKSLSS